MPVNRKQAGMDRKVINMSEYKLKAPKAAKAVVEAEKKIEGAVVGAYKKVEDTVVGSCKKIEDTVVGSYKKVEGKFVNAFLEKADGSGEQDGESQSGEGT